MKKWVQADALRLAQPFPLMQYVVLNNLEGRVQLAWVKDMVADADRMERMAQGFKTSTNSGPKYKFGIEVPRGTRHASVLDALNGNSL